MSKDLIVAPRALASVPGIDANGLTETSKVAFVEISAASLTSIGPDTEARTCTSSREDRTIRNPRCVRMFGRPTKPKPGGAIDSAEQLIPDGNPTSPILVGKVDSKGG